MTTDNSDLLDTVFEAAVIPDLWPDVIERVSHLVDGDGGAMVTVAGGQMRHAASPRFAPHFARYLAGADVGANIRPQRFLARRHHGFLRDIDLCTTEELARDPIYETYLRPAGYDWTVGTVIPVPGRDMAVLEIVRRAGAEPFRPDEVAVLDALRPHLARSAHLSARLGLVQAQSIAAMLEALGLPGAVLGADLRVIAANRLFDGLAPVLGTAARDRLCSADARTDRLLRARAAQAMTAPGAGVRSIPVPALGGQPPLIVHQTPVRRAARDIFAAAQWIAVITPVTQGKAPDADLLQGLFDLTAAEARVARRVLGGATADDIARDHAVSVSTVRTQIRSVLAKCGVSRQVDLVALLGGVNTPWTHSGV